MVYLIHLDAKYHHAQHYIGYTIKSAKRRLLQHRSGCGSKMLRAVNAAGISYRIARYWGRGTRKDERRLNNYKKARLLCPICNKHLNKRK